MNYIYNHKPLKIYWKPLLDIFLFGSKKNINYQIKLTLNLHSSYQSLFYSRNVRSFGNCPSGKCPFGELPVRGTVLRRTVPRGTVCLANVFGELSVGQKYVGEISVEELLGYLTEEVKYSVNFTKSRKKICLSLHCSNANSCMLMA